MHGIAVNPKTRHVYVNDRNNGRMQVFDENGKFLDQWDAGPRPPMNIHSITMGNDGVLWAADQGSNKLVGYDANGNFLYSWGTFGTCQGCQWGVHGFATDKDGQSLHRRSENRSSAEVHAAQGRQPRVSRGQALARRVVRPASSLARSPAARR